MKDKEQKEKRASLSDVYSVSAETGTLIECLEIITESSLKAADVITKIWGEDSAQPILHSDLHKALEEFIKESIIYNISKLPNKGII